MIIKKKLTLTLLLTFLVTIIFWETLDLTIKLTPGLDDRLANLEKYYLYYDRVIDGDIDYPSSIEGYFKVKIDIGYVFLNYLSNILGLTFENFLFIAIFSTYLIYIKIFYRLTSCKNSIIYVALIMFASFWMSSTIGSTLRQGIAISFLFYFLFYNKKTSFKKSIFIIFIASLIHMSAFILIPYLIIEKLFIKKLKLLSFFYVILIIVYILEINSFVRDFLQHTTSAIDFETRSLMFHRPNHPSVGFTFFRLLATITPPILFLLSFYINKNPIQMIERRMYVYYVYASSLGLLISQVTYYERILVYAWAFSPFLLAFFCDTIYRSFFILPKKNFKSIK